MEDYRTVYPDKEIPLMGVRDYDKGIKSMDNGKNRIILTLTFSFLYYIFHHHHYLVPTSVQALLIHTDCAEGSSETSTRIYQTTRHRIT